MSSLKSKGTATLLGVVPLTSVDAEWYMLKPPYQGQDYVRVSTASVIGRLETYIFPCNKDGEVTDWLEMDGSVSKGEDHTILLDRLGYKVI